VTTTKTTRSRSASPKPLTGQPVQPPAHPARSSATTPSPLPPPQPAPPSNPPLPLPQPAPSTRYVAGKPMQRDGVKIKIGDELPDAGSWKRLESWIRTGYVKEIVS
jgi:hypothetical protein